MRYPLLWILLLLGFASVALAQAPATRPAGLTLWVPGSSWAMAIEGGDYKVDERETAPAGRAVRLFASSRRAGVMVSAFIEPAHAPGDDAKAARAYFLEGMKASPLPQTNLQLWEERGFALAQYTTSLSADHPEFAQVHVHVYGARNDCWTDVHFSGMGGNEEQVRELAKTVTFVDGYEPSAAEREAANAPVKKLEQRLMRGGLRAEEEKQTILQIAIWYGESGEIVKAREVLNRGLAKYPEYPLFYYNLACADAEQGQLDSAAGYLRLAWRYRQGLAAGETLPDPRTDSSFKEAMKNERFRRAIQDLMQAQ